MAYNPEIFLDHRIAQAWGNDQSYLQKLNDAYLLKAAVLQLAKGLNLTALDSFTHKFEPFGLSLILIVSESHLAVHTWPEHGYIHFDVLSCSKEADLSNLEQVLKKEFEPDKIIVQKIEY